jgi:hypothetical protein
MWTNSSPVPTIDAPEDIQQNLGRPGVIQNSENKASPIYRVVNAWNGLAGDTVNKGNT